MSWTPDQLYDGVPDNAEKGLVQGSDDCSSTTVTLVAVRNHQASARFLGDEKKEGLRHIFLVKPFKPSTKQALHHNFHSLTGELTTEDHRMALPYALGALLSPTIESVALQYVWNLIT